MGFEDNKTMVFFGILDSSINTKMLLKSFYYHPGLGQQLVSKLKFKKKKLTSAAPGSEFDTEKPSIIETILGV